MPANTHVPYKIIAAVEVCTKDSRTQKRPGCLGGVKEGEKETLVIESAYFSQTSVRESSVQVSPEVRDSTL